MFNDLSNRLLMAWFRRGFERDQVPQSAREGYDGFLEEALAFDRLEQRERFVEAHFLHYLGPAVPLVAQGMKRFPGATLAALRQILPISLEWLVGKSKPTSNGIQIERCKFLDGTSQDACLRLCKQPTETFFAKHLRVKANFAPNFADSSCRVDFRP